MPGRPPADELEPLLNRAADRFAETMLRIALAQIDGRVSEEKAIAMLADEIAEVMALADLFGRRRAWLEFDAAGGDGAAQMRARAPVCFAAPLVPDVPFDEAIKDLISRDPRLADGWREVARIYREDHAFALAKSSSEQITERAQKAVEESLRGEVSGRRTQSIIATMGDWTHSYAETVYRTNVASAYEAGRTEQSKNPAIRRTMKAFERFSARDVDVRPSHQLVHGLLDSIDSPVWEKATPPSGYG